MTTIYTPKHTPHLYLQRWIDGKRLRLSTGLHDTKAARRTVGHYDAMLNFLMENGKPDVVEAIRVGMLSLADAYAEYRIGRWEKIPTAQHAVDLAKAWKAWAAKAKRRKDGKPVSASHRADLVRALDILDAPKGGTVGQLPAFMAALRDTCGDAGHARTFNRVRANAMAFARAHGGARTNPVWLAIAEFAPLDEEATRRAHHPMGPKEAMALATTLGPGCGDDWWSLCLTGMRPSEYYGGKWLVDAFSEAPRITISGTKSMAAGRVIPLLGPAMRPYRAVAWLRTVLRRHGVTPYDARRSFAHWLEEAGIPDSRCDLYMGHRPRAGVRGLYRIHDVTPHLAADREILIAYIQGEK